MFDVGGSELLVIGIVALIVIGPKDLPGMFHTLGRFTARARSMAREFSRAMDEAAKESGVGDVAKDLKSMTSTRSLGLDKLSGAVDKFEKWDPMKKTPPAPTVPFTGPKASGGSVATSTPPAGAPPDGAGTGTPAAADATTGAAKAATVSGNGGTPERKTAPKAARTTATKAAAPKAALPTTETPKAATREAAAPATVTPRKAAPRKTAAATRAAAAPAPDTPAAAPPAASRARKKPAK